MKKLNTALNYDNYVDQSDDGFILLQSKNIYRNNPKFIYEIYDFEGNYITKWLDNCDALSMSTKEYLKSEVRKKFIELKDEAIENGYYIYDYEDIDYYNDIESYPFKNYYSSYNYITEEEAFKKYNNSDTLVIHKTDPTTTMLDQIYKGKNWDVINDVYSLNHETLHKLIESHERIVMLGHGTGEGLIGSISSCCAQYLKNKNIFVIWCNADKYFNKYCPSAKGKFITKNAPSEVGECKAAGCGNISAELMLENITYWCKLCGDVVEDCLNGRIDSSVEYIRKNYLEKYGNHPVTIFNADSAHKFGTDTPLPKYTFKGKKLTKKDYPYPDFNEEEFLKNPVNHI